eukprot:2470481-Pleurochrysis_carterae.AAC.2
MERRLSCPPEGHVALPCASSAPCSRRGVPTDFILESVTVRATIRSAVRYCPASSSLSIAAKFLLSSSYNCDSKGTRRNLVSTATAST